MGCCLDTKRREGKVLMLMAIEIKKKQRGRDEAEKDETDDVKQMTKARKDTVKVMMITEDSEEER